MFSRKEKKVSNKQKTISTLQMWQQQMEALQRASKPDSMNTNSKTQPLTKPYKQHDIESKPLV